MNYAFCNLRLSRLFGHVLTLKKAMESEDMMIQDLLYQW